VRAESRRAEDETPNRKTTKAMKTRTPQLILGAALLLAPLTPTFAQPTWETVDEFIVGTSGAIFGLAAFDNGVVFSTGCGNDLAGIQRAFVHRSLNGGQTWATVCDLPNSATSMSMAVTVGRRSGLVFATATLRSPKNNGWNDWVTLRSASHARGIAADASGNLFVTGQAEFVVNKVPHTHWITRKSSDNGTTWRTVDDTLIDTYGNYGGYGCAVTVDAFGRVFANGTYISGSGTTSTNHWLTRASVDGGETWTTTEDYIALGGAIETAAASDAAGNVFTAGRARTVLANPTAVVRKLAAP
jgi:hypothetical protein